MEKTVYVVINKNTQTPVIVMESREDAVMFCYHSEGNFWISCGLQKDCEVRP
jgi:hypothetical protein